MSAADFIACFSAASAQIRNCSVANGARVVYDGCFLRYFPGSWRLIKIRPESSPSSKIGAIIGGAAGGAALVLLIVGLFVWFKLSKKRRAARRGKGTLKNGKVVAVKKLALGHSNRVKADFASEVTLISNVHHRKSYGKQQPLIDFYLVT
ncbi:CYSTEINE-RICH RLK (RECEPTOR-LIKE KINASE) PROTEIN [Salix purpurea]|uniref:CYSTEINE-RICH RLK (RECEPTOR-LIKE KINASE) PROTEIN n=1 Tax=Salix purpurea TaxID=77065 RepID=A0A9Q0URW5_SALPP|nr:CYSTEINE-RICH RLK (RECEPTOR-LIKE KINASE) PROTEIN [Salix purpurea]